jgi:hypothetical protein
LHSAHSLKFTEKIKQKQDGTKGSFRREELFKAEVIRSPIVFQFGYASLHGGAVIVITPDLLGCPR